MSKASEYSEIVRSVKRPWWGATNNSWPIATVTHEGSLEIQFQDHKIHMRESEVPKFIKWLQETFIDE